MTSQDDSPPSTSSANTTASLPPAAPRPSFALSEEIAAHALETARMLASEVASVESRETRAVLLHEASEVDERVRGDELGAAKGYLAAFNSRPAFRPPLDALIRLYTRRRSVGNLAKLYEALIKAAASPRDRADALALRGELQEDRLADPASARASYEQAVATDPTARSPWLDLERIALRQNDPELLVRVLTQLAELARDPTRKAGLLHELAAEYARQGTPAAVEEAVRCLREAASLPLGRWRTLIELERLGERTGRFGDVAFTLEARAALAQQVAEGQAFQGGSGSFAIPRLEGADAAREIAADLWGRAARLRLTALHQPEEARNAMDQALALKPEDPRYRFFAMVLADQAGEIERASAQAAWLLDHGVGDPYLRASLHFRIAETAALHNETAAAAESLHAALALDPGSAAARGALVEQLVATGDGLQVVQEFDRLAESAPAGAARAALRRAAAVYALALRGDVEGAVQHFRLACDDDPADVVSRRALVTLLARRAVHEADPAARGELERGRLGAIEELLHHVVDDDERTALLLERFFVERHDLGDHHAAAQTAEQLVEATGEEPWAMESAALLWAAAGSMGFAARWAEALAARTDLPGGDADAAGWRAAAARWAWAAGDDARARELAVAAHRAQPDNAYLAALAFRLAMATPDPALALDVATRAAEANDPETGSRWLLMASAVLAGAGASGASEASRQALDAAVERAPGAPAVRAALLASTRWRGDADARARLADAALEGDACGPEEVALGVEFALVRAFVDHDAAGAAEVVERVAGRDAGSSAAVGLLHALARGAWDGVDSEGTITALQEMLQAIPSNDPLRIGIELEVARALGASSATRDQAAAALELVDEDQPQLVAPRLLALLDAIQREGREDVPAALGRVADLGDAATADALRGVAVASLRAQGRTADARALAMRFPQLPASVVTLSEIPAGLDRAAEYGDALARRAALAVGATKTALDRAAASWASVGGHDGAALERAAALLAEDPTDLVALDVERVAGRRLGQWSHVAHACSALASQVHGAVRAAAFWEEAGVVAADELGDPARAETCLRAALDAAPARDLAYRKLPEILEARRDIGALEALVTRRVEAVADPAARADLYWEQARLRRALGRREEALESATRVVALAPDNVAARALVAEVHAASGRLPETAEALVALAACRETPRVQRKATRLGAVDLFDLRLRKPARALEQIEALAAEGDADDALIERGVAIALRAELWDAALRFAERAAERARGTPGTPGTPGRAAAMLRVAHLHRDRLRDPDAARVYAVQAHEAFPGDLEVLRTLQGLSDPDERPRHARRTVEALREGLRGAVTAERVLGIAEAARSGGDGVLERAALRLVRALGVDAVAPPPALALPAGPSLRDPALVLRYRNPADSGRAVTLFETVLPDLAELAGATTDALKVGRAERIRGAHPVRAAVAPFVAAAGFGDFELYQGGPDAGRIAVVPGDPVAVVLGRGVAVPLGEAARFDLVRALLLAARGAAALAHDPVETAVGRCLAALVYAEVPVAVGTQRIEALLRPVARAVSRKVRRTIAESGRALAASPDAWDELAQAARAILSTARRGALAVSGAVERAFEDLARVEGLPPAAPAALAASEAPARDLCLFAVSDALAQIERETGVDRR